MQTLTESPAQTQKDFLPLNGTDYVEFYVGNAKQAAYFYRSAFGMRLTAYRGPETGVRDCNAEECRRDRIRAIAEHRRPPEQRREARQRRHVVRPPRRRIAALYAFIARDRLTLTAR